MEAHYKNLNQKLDTLQNRQLDKSKIVHNQQGQQFYTRTEFKLYHVGGR